MPGRIADNEAHILLNNRFGAAAVPAPPGTYYVGLSSTQPNNAGGNITEPVGGGYARVPFANNATNFPAASNRQKKNGTAITFPQASADWGTNPYVIFMDATTGGAMRAWGTVTTDAGAAVGPITAGTVASFAANAVTINMPA